MRGAVALAALLVGGCASQSLLLLPDEGGGQGQVAVLESGGRAQETVVGAGNSRTRLGGARPATRAVDPARLPDRDRQVLADLPEPPRSFTLNFVEGSTRLVPASEPELQALFAEVARRPGADVQVTGHTDALGSGDDNDALSQKRAEEIRGLLIERGMAPDIVSAVGRGERELLVKTADGIRNADNRRVEVIVR